MGDSALNEPQALHRDASSPVRTGFGAVQASVKALDLSGDLNPAVELCCAGPANYRAASLAFSLKQARAKGSYGAVYVIGPDEAGVHKVGFGADPQTRLWGLQNGNWHELSIKALVWFDSNPGAVEGLVHRAAKEMGIWLRGEWLECSATEACELILKAARYRSDRAYDSGMWIENWGARAQALSDSRRTTVQIAA